MVVKIMCENCTHGCEHCTCHEPSLAEKLAGLALSIIFMAHIALFQKLAEVKLKKQMIKMANEHPDELMKVLFEGMFSAMEGKQ
jgi:hypothetical protein